MAFGVKVKLGVDKSSASKSEFRGQVQELANSVTSKSPIKLTNFKIDLAPDQRKTLANSLQDALAKSQLTIKIKSIDASDAVKNLKSQLTTMLSGLSITGLREFLGDAGAGEAYEKAAKAAEKHAEALENVRRRAVETNTALAELRNLNSALNSTYKAVGKVTDAQSIDQYLDRYRELTALIEEARHLEGSDQSEAVAGIASRVMALNREVSARLELEKAARKEAEAKKNAAAESEQAAIKEANFYRQVVSLRQNVIQYVKDNQDAYSDNAEIFDKIIADLNDELSITPEKLALIREAYARVTESAKELGQTSKATAQAEREVIKEANLYKQVIDMRQKVSQYVNNNPQAYTANQEILDRIIADLNNELDMTPAKLALIREQFGRVVESAKELNQTGKGFFGVVEEAWQRFSPIGTFAKTMSSAVNAVKTMIGNVADLDAAMTELKKVTDLTDAGYRDFMDEANEIARRAGATMKDTINATADFARLGFEVSDATALAEAALVYKNVGDGINDVSTATESLISTLRAFGMEASDSMRIVDMFNEVGNRFAISSTGIGEALTRSAAALAAGGNTLEESIGLITAANEILQNPATVGTAMKTLTMYLRAAKTEAEEAGIETDGMATSVSKLREELLSLTGVDIQLDEHTFKSTFQIVKEISEVFGQLDDITQANVTNLLGGKRGANSITALMNNFSQAIAAAETATNSLGSATRENEKYLDSIAGKIALFHESVENLSRDFINSDLIKLVVDAGRAIIDVLDKIIQLTGSLPTATAAITAALTAFGKVQSVFGTMQRPAEQGGRLALTIGGEFWNAASSGASTFSTALKSVASGLSLTSVKTALVNTGVKALAVGLSALKSFGIALLIQGVISGITTLIQKQKERAEAARREREENVAAAEQVNSNVSSYLELVDALRKGTISASEFEKKASDIQGTLAAQGSIVKDLTGDYNALNKEILTSAVARLTEGIRALNVELQDQQKELKNAYSWWDKINNTQIDFDKDGKIGAAMSARAHELGYEFAGRTSSILLDNSGMDGSPEAINARIEELERLMDAFDEIKGASTTAAYKQVNDELVRLKGVAAEYNETLKTIQERTIERAFVTQVLTNGIPETADEYQALRQAIIDAGTASDAFSGSGEDAAATITEMTDSLLDAQGIFGQFKEEADSATQTVTTSARNLKESMVSLADGIKSISDSTSAMDKALSDMEKYGGITGSTLATMQGLMGDGEKISDYLYEENGLLQLDTAAWMARTRSIREARIDDLEKYIALLEEENDRIPETVDGIDKQNAAIDANNKEIEAARIEIAAYNAELQKTPRSDWSDVLSIDELSKTLDQVETQYQNMVDLQQKLTQSDSKALGLNEILELLKEFPDVLQHLDEFDITTTEGQLGLIEQIMTSLETARSTAIETKKTVVDAALESDELDAQTRESLKGLLAYLIQLGGISLGDLKEEVKETFDPAPIKEAISAIEKAKGMLTDIHNGDGDTLSMLQTAADMAADANKSLSDFVSFENGRYIFNEEAVRNWAYTYVDALTDIEGITDDAREALKEMVKAEIEAADAAERVDNAYSKLNGARGVEGTYGGYTQLTYEGFKALMEIDQHYASAIEYQNGVLTLNGDKHAAVTQKILEETRAAAVLEKQNILLSDEYQRLLAAFKAGTISTPDLQRLTDLQVQIKGFSTLTHEIDSASSAYSRWLNRKGDDGMDRYSQAIKAFELINSTLNDKESEYYGRIGREEFTQAVDFVIGEHVEVNTEEFKRGMEIAKRYLTEGAQGAANFYDDLVSKGILDATTGALNGTLDEMSEKMNMSTEMFRTMVDRLNEYQKEANKIHITEPTVGTSEEDTLLNEMLTSLEQAKATVDTLNNTPLDIRTSSTESRLRSVYNSLTQIANKVLSINGASATISVGTKTIGSTSSATNMSGYQRFLQAIGRSGAHGGAFAEGGKTLVGELGREIVVDPHNNRWYTVGDDGAEFVVLPKDAIVFNHRQTRQLLNNGKTSRGASMASGNAAAAMNSQVEGGRSSGTSLWNTLTSAVKSLATAPTKLANTLNNASKAITTAVTTTAKKASDIVASIGTQRPTGATTQTSGTGYGSGSGSSGSGGGGGGSSTQQEADALAELNRQMEHLIAHQEHLYKVAERGYDYKGMAASLTEQARIYRMTMNEAQAHADELIAQGVADTDEELQKYEEAAWSAYDSMNNVLDQLNKLYVDGLNQKIDGIQDAYKDLQSAANEFKDNGTISLDIFQALLDNGLQYMSLLKNVNGQYVINTDAIEKMLAAEKEQLAIETALSYLDNVKSALSNGDRNAVDRLVDSSEKVSSNTWNAVYAQAAMLKNAGLTNAQYTQIVNNIEAMRAISAGVSANLTSGASETKSSIEDILDLVEKLIEYETKQHIQAIKDQVSAYKEIVNLKKESLKASREEDDYDKKVADKVKEIADMQSKINQLALDDSRSAQAERTKLLKDLTDLQSDMAELQDEHAYDTQVDILDNMAKAYEDSRQTEIDALEASVSSQEKVYQLAIERIRTGWSTLYGDLINWNTEAGSVLNSEITRRWEAAAEAAAQYGGYLNALNAFGVIGSASSKNNGQSLIVANVPKYHSGGSVGSTGSINDDEVLAKLQKGELVLNDKGKEGLYELVDFAAELGAKLGTTVRNISAPVTNFIARLAGGMMPAQVAVAGAGGMTFNPEINVTINHDGGISEGEARNYGREIATVAIDGLYDAFVKRGLTALGGAALKH